MQTRGRILRSQHVARRSRIRAVLGETRVGFQPIVAIVLPVRGIDALRGNAGHRCTGIGLGCECRAIALETYQTHIAALIERETRRIVSTAILAPALAPFLACHPPAPRSR